MNEGNIYGYARVSAKDQHLARQYDALHESGVLDKNIFADKSTGSDFNRPSYKRLIRKLKPKDTVFIKSIDRLGRNYDEILEEWRHITKDIQADIVVIDMPILDTRIELPGITGVFLTDIILQILSYIAQVERENTKQRQAEGIAAAKARGVKFGRPKIIRSNIYENTKQLYQSGIITRKEAASRMRIGTTTFDTWLKQDEDTESR